MWTVDLPGRTVFGFVLFHRPDTLPTVAAFLLLERTAWFVIRIVLELSGPGAGLVGTLAGQWRHLPLNGIIRIGLIQLYETVFIFRGLRLASFTLYGFLIIVPDQGLYTLLAVAMATVTLDRRAKYQLAAGAFVLGIYSLWAENFQWVSLWLPRTSSHIRDMVLVIHQQVNQCFNLTLGNNIYSKFNSIS